MKSSAKHAHVHSDFTSGYQSTFHIRKFPSSLLCENIEHVQYNCNKNVINTHKIEIKMVGMKNQKKKTTMKPIKGSFLEVLPSLKIKPSLDTEETTQ